MSVEDRLFALAQQCRQQNGDAFLASPQQFVPRLNSQAPDLHAEIRALAAAFEMGAAARVTAAPDPEAAASTVSSEIAVRERLSMASVAPALAVARRIGPLNAAAMAPRPQAAGWAGDSLAVGAGAPVAPAAPAYHPAPAYAAAGAPAYAPQPPQPAAADTDKVKALTKNPWAIGAAVVVAGFFIYQNFMRAPSETIQTAPIVGGDTQQPPMTDGTQQQPPVNNDGTRQQPPNTNGGGQFPLLQPPGPGAPTLSVQQHPSGGPAIGFAISTPRGAAPGMVMLPAGGWQSGPVGFGLANPGDTSGQFATQGQGQFQLLQSDGYPIRLAQIQMSQDSLGVGGVCVMFRGQPNQQDVQLSGADFCVMDGPCSRPIGCGKLQ